jgi:hypothetical protein
MRGTGEIANMERKTWYFALIGAAIGAMLAFNLFFAAFIMAGAGHGNNVLFKVFFPYAMILSWKLHLSKDVELVTALCLIQYPLYGFIMGLVLKKSVVYFVALTLTCLHVVCIWIAMKQP